MPQVLRTPQAIDEKCSLVAQFPEMGRRRPELGFDARSTLVERYVMIYRAVDDGMQIPRLFQG